MTDTTAEKRELAHRFAQAVRYDATQVEVFKLQHPVWDTALGTLVVLFSNGEHQQIQSLDCVNALRLLVEKLSEQALHIVGIIDVGSRRMPSLVAQDYRRVLENSGWTFSGTLRPRHSIVVTTADAALIVREALRAIPGAEIVREMPLAVGVLMLLVCTAEDLAALARQYDIELFQGDMLLTASSKS